MIIILNGVPRSGKSSIAREIQATFEGIWINLGVDHSMATTPKHLLPGIGLRPGCERPDLEPTVKLLYQALFDSIAVYARLGINVVVDIGIHEQYSWPLGIWEEMKRQLAEFQVVCVGVRCASETIRDRRNQIGMPASEEVIDRWERAVHLDRAYDIEVNTALNNSLECSKAISEYVFRKEAAE
jgi:chloramphenicol 3-O phosphotransferase